jgi:hypothetical protein
MSARLTVIFYIVLCLEAGIVLTFLPWTNPFGLSDWGDNFFLVYAAQKMGSHALQHAVASGWVRGAVTGIGMLNLAMAFWEMFHFSETVRRLQGADAAPESRGSASNAFAPHAAESLPTTNDPDAASTPTADNVPHHERRDD